VVSAEHDRRAELAAIAGEAGKLRDRALRAEAARLVFHLEQARIEAESQSAVVNEQGEPAFRKPYTPETLAERWQCSANHIRKLIASGDLTAFRIGGKVFRIPAHAVDDYELRAI
jgi:excisionase family DNA binding protein